MEDSLQAEFWKRGAAFVLDATAIYVQAIFLTVVLHHLWQIPMPSPNALKLIDIVRALSILLLGGWLYFAVTESSAKQASFGKRALGIMVTDLQGQRISFRKATVRFWLKFFAGFLLMIPYGNNRVSHDVMSGTLVANKQNGKLSHALTYSLWLQPNRRKDHQS